MTQYQPHMPKRIHSHGFTLVELMVTITVMGIIAAFAIPNMQQQLSSKRIKSTSEIIPNAVQFAKSQALINRQPLNIEIGAHQVIVKKDGGDALETYVMDNKTTITAKNSAPTIFKVSPTGAIAKADGTAIPANAYFEICDSQLSGETGRKVIMNAVGQIQIESGVVCS